MAVKLESQSDEMSQRKFIDNYDNWYRRGRLV